MTIASKLQLTLAIIKPHIVKNPISSQKIREIIISSNFKIVKSRRKIISLEEANTFYGEHKEKFFYKRLVSFMTSGPSDIMILAKENAIKDWRQLMGPTKVFKAQFEAPESIRGQFGLSDTRNASHGSDSEESARREIGIFFPSFDFDKWYQEDEPLFRSNKADLCLEQFLHLPVTRYYR
ncbi:nucleoside diphosphate kinase 6 [Diabrotica virgifera virgifera]|uniref:Nucleoside diphosphate kinase n=1 Tax=Diabrotica virgifera virgifera TaxID=50390 RepID=A0A6P7G7M5_DIAVI|nr:nucleoside diphosphate kinase 6 [Diabrotica virgifera virgifera]